MKRKLFLAVLAMVGGCDHHHGLGTLGPDAGTAMSGRDAGGFSIDMGGGTQASGGFAAIPGGGGGNSGNNTGGNGGCGILCIGSVGGTGGDTVVSSSSNTCGNGVIDNPGDEQCDDGNRVNGDGCNALCQVEANWLCPNPGQACILRGPLGQYPTSWTGYIENYQFASGSDVIDFTFAIDFSGQVIGKVVLGNGTPPPPATDPNVGYSANLPDAMGKVVRDPVTGYWAEGFAYSMAKGTFSPERLRFTISNFELWSGWCALQTPVDDSGMCLPNWGGSSNPGSGTSSQCYQQNPANGQNTVVDCGKFNLCVVSRVCLCSTTACVFDPNGGTPASFDLAISGTTANGSVTGIIGDRANVHFTQDPY
jgi:cysteine-rich repeat protein